jgi:hypothetical protein
MGANVRVLPRSSVGPEISAPVQVDGREACMAPEYDATLLDDVLDHTVQQGCPDTGPPDVRSCGHSPQSPCQRDLISDVSGAEWWFLEHDLRRANNLFAVVEGGKTPRAQKVVRWQP